ncbi:MAG: hypothetical protein A2138_24040 [Deltaproteobacteria bacterium RBG_16_71_12]|nr:MAG: hypothetical protein A2138_24040 [Deltaproteobacteria bacterium RBG_16_71_12]
MLQLAVWLVTTPLLAAGCAPNPCEGTTGASAVDVGTGHDEFAALHDGDTVPYVRGIQGGTHVEGALRATGLHAPKDPFAHAEELPTVSMLLRDDDGAMIGGYRQQPRALSHTGDAAVLLGELVIFFEDAAARVGATLTLAADVTDVCGASAADERAFVLAAPER